MDDIKQIAISRIADILSSSYLIVPQIDIWKKIFNNAGLSETYEANQYQLSEKEEEINWTKKYYHNDRCYSALNEILGELEPEKDMFLSLLNNIADKLYTPNVFEVDIDKKVGKRSTFGIFNIDQYLEGKKLLERNDLLTRYPSKEFKILKSNINILNLDIQFTDDGLRVIPFTNRVVESSFDENILVNWLSEKYTTIKDSYTDAIKAYSNGDDAGCITHCRNTITGIFSINKQEQTKWMDGLKTACNKDKNITNVQTNQIHTIKYNINSSNVNERYQYPRYKLIYSLYTFTCALGAHINEGNKTEEGVDSEVATMEDAFMALRMTEDVLIWLYQTNGIVN